MGQALFYTLEISAVKKTLTDILVQVGIGANDKQVRK